MKAVEMTPRERVLEALHNRQPDRVPVVAMYFGGFIHRAGYKYAECLEDGDKFVAAAKKCYEDFRFDGIFDLTQTSLIAEAIGAKVRLIDDVPIAGEPVLNDYSELDKLEPRDFRSSGRLPHLLSVISKMRKALGPDVAIFTVGTVPIRLAVCLRGVNQLYKDIHRNPEFVKRLMEFCLQPTIDCAEAVVEAGADVVLLPNGHASRDVLSLKHYMEFNYPYVRRQFDAFNEKGIDFWFHGCGDYSDRLDTMVDGPTGLWLEPQMDIGEVKALYGHKVSLGGNIDSVNIMAFGTPEDVDREARECLRKGAQGGGFILGAGCALPRDTPEENLHALVSAAWNWTE